MPIAIIGIGCRLPGGVVDAESFWRMLANGEDAITEFPPDRFDIAAYHDARPATPGKVMTRWGGFIRQRLDEFDAEFFGISRHYAERLDPQQRLLLETAWESLEDAGQDILALSGTRTGVFIGQWLSDFEHRLFADHAQIDFAATLGSGRYAVPGRLSYALGLRGPSLSVDAGCSAGLAAVHLAVRSLRSGESTMALAGGVNVILQPHIHVAYSQSRMMAPDGRCKFGDARGDGYVRAEGVGVVVLKPLTQALADGDRVYAVIRGSAVNSDGDSSGSMGTPSRVGQEELLRAALRDANVAPADVSYVEAHGTGTRAGDPVELGVLATVLSEGRAAGQRAWVGSVKTNIGHTEATAGVAGLIKGALMVQRGLIPPSLNFRDPNPGIAWNDVPVAIPTSLHPWPTVGRSRVVGVSSFGIGGTNAHVVLESAPEPSAVGDAAMPGGPYLLPLSARGERALRALAADYATTLASPTSSVYAVCRAAARRRSALSHRAVFVAADREGLVEQLRAYAAGAPAIAEGTVYAENGAPPVAFVAPGQGGQWHGMARQLIASAPAFRTAFLECDEACRAVVPWSLAEQLELAVDAPAYLGDRIDVIQPMLVALAIAYAAWLRAMGVMPGAVVGHSLGEVAAAAISGALDVPTAMRVVCLRSALMRKTSGRGAMAVIELPAEVVRARLTGREHLLSVAVSNSPHSTVVSGAVDEVHALIAALDAEGVFARLIKVDVASHGPQMEPLVESLVSGLDGMTARVAAAPLYSTVLAARVDGTELSASYWGRNLRQPVRFKETIEGMVADGSSVFVELGPHAVLSLAVAQTATAVGRTVTTVACGQRDADDVHAAWSAIATLWASGVSVDWTAIMPAPAPHVELPRYPWQRERYWCAAADGSPSTRATPRHAGAHPFLGSRVETAAESGGVEWSVAFDAARSSWLADHVVRGTALVPAAAIIESMLAAAQETFGADAPVELVQVALDEAVPLVANDRVMRLVGRRVDPGTMVFHLRVNDGSEWRTVAHGRGRKVAAVSGDGDADFVETRGAVSARLDRSSFYRAMARRQLQYGPRFQIVDALEHLGSEARASLSHVADDPVELAVTTLDGALQSLLALTPLSVVGADETVVPTAFERIAVCATTWPHGVRAVARVASTDGQGVMTGSVHVVGAPGSIALVAEGVRMEAVRKAGAPDLDALRYRIGWQPVAMPLSRDAVVGSVLIVGEATGLAGRLSHDLRRAGVDVLEWRAAEALSERAVPSTVREILICTPTEVPTTVDPDAFESAMVLSYDVPLALIQRAVTAERATSVRLLTAGAVSVTHSEEVTSPLQAATWGLARVARQEHPTLDCVVIDADVESLASLIGAGRVPPDELELAGRDGQWWAGRVEHVRPATPATTPAPDMPYRLLANSGVVDDVAWITSPRRAPGPNEVEVAVVASGLNFLDVLVVLNAYPASAATTRSYAPQPGLECSGVVTRIGGGVTGVAVGDRVMAIGEGALGSHVVVHEALVARVPAGVTMEDAAGFPLAFLTAAHALEEVARLRAGERVLIHSAAGGVGLAALQIARLTGAEVYATAGTPDKRAWLRAQGIVHVFDSRGLAWSDEVLAATDGRGVDVVLNSLSGPAIEAGLRTLANRGRFVEIGKRDVFGGSRMGMEVFQRQATVSCVCLLAQMRDQPAHLGSRFREIVHRLEQGELAILPTTPWPSAQIADAFRSLLPGTHVGKAVVTHDGLPQNCRAIRPSLRVRDDATYVITGGLGALGLRSAQWLADRAARHLLLVGRSAPDAATLATIDALVGAGVTIRIASSDLAQDDHVHTVLAEMPPVAGVLHAAGVLDDGLLTAQTPQRLRAVALGKVRGLLRLASRLDLETLDFVLLFSSVAGTFGTRGQANYAAANGVLDAMAHALRARGVPATSVGFGPIAGRGLATEGQRLQILAERGIGALRLDTVPQVLDALAGSAMAHELCVAFDAAAWVAASHPSERRRFTALLDAEVPSASTAGIVAASIRERLEGVRSHRQRADLMLDFVRAEVAAVLRAPLARVEPLKALRTMGIDSLTALELRNRLEQATSLRLPGTLVFTYPTVSAIAAHLLAGLTTSDDSAAVDEWSASGQPTPGPGVNAGAGDADLDALAQELASLDEAELSRLLGQPEGAGS